MDLIKEKSIKKTDCTVVAKNKMMVAKFSTGCSKRHSNKVDPRKKCR